MNQLIINSAREADDVGDTAVLLRPCRPSKE